MAKKDGIEISIDDMKKVIDSIENLTKSNVLVGIPEENAGRTGEQTVNNAFLGYIHENGAPEVNIPPRPFLVPGIYNAKESIVNYMKQAGVAALDGNDGRSNRALHAAGMSAASSVKLKIQQGPFQALKKSTITARKNRKIAPRDSDQPLQDTLQLLKSVTYVIENEE